MKRFLISFVILFGLIFNHSYALDLGFGIIPYAQVGYYKLGVKPNEYVTSNYIIDGLGGGAGLQLEFDIAKNLTLNPGVEFLVSTSEKPDSTIIVKLKDSYVNIPIIVNYWIPRQTDQGEEETGYFIGIGPKLAFFLDGNSSTATSFSYRSPIADQVGIAIGRKLETKMGVMASANAGYQFENGVRANIVFDYCLTNLIKNSDATSAEASHLFLGIQLGWLF